MQCVLHSQPCLLAHLQWFVFVMLGSMLLEQSVEIVVLLYLIASNVIALRGVQDVNKDFQ